MARSRGFYHNNVYVDYVVIRGGKQELCAYDLFLNATVVNKHFSYSAILDLDKDADTDADTDTDLSPGGQYATPLEQEQLVNGYTQHVTDKLKPFLLSSPCNQRSVLFVSSSIIPRPLIEITGARPEMIVHFLNCFRNVYMVNGESFCNPTFADKWITTSLPEHLRVAHTTLDGYIPVTLRDSKEVYLLGQKDGNGSDRYLLYKDDHITYIEMAHHVYRLNLRWTDEDFPRNPDCEYTTGSCGIFDVVHEYHSLKSELVLTKLRTLLAYIFDYCVQCNAFRD